MATITLNYDARNSLISGLIELITKAPGVKVVKESKSKSRTKEQLSLLERAKKIDKSINKNAKVMTMDEIVKEVRDYRNGK